MKCEICGYADPPGAAFGMAFAQTPTGWRCMPCAHDLAYNMPVLGDFFAWLSKKLR